MTAGLPGAGIGGLFYLGSTLLLPIRALARRVRGIPSDVSPRQLAECAFLALGIIVALWGTGWLLGFALPDELLTPGSAAGTSALARRSVIPVATFVSAVATLAGVLVVVEVGHHVQKRRYPHPRTGSR